ncbi:MAG: hypothetical protein IIW56_10675 [Oscillospiraceae bacterium]|nr:hypothetical protein [Oscillospiraceae bacterium]
MIRKIICILLVCCLLLIAGCREPVPPLVNTTATEPSITALEPTAGTTETTTAATEPEETQATEAATVPTEPQATEPTKAPTQPTDPTEPSKPEQTIPKPTEPAPTEPTPTETVPPEPPTGETVPPTTEPEQTQPTETKPAPTEPTECQHDWVSIHHAEVGHWRAGIMCDCGWTVYGDPGELTALWNAHSASFPPAESLFEHGGFGSMDEWIVDTPAYSEWVCQQCGQPKE